MRRSTILVVAAVAVLGILLWLQLCAGSPGDIEFHPLAPLDAASEETVFHRIPGEESGLVFRNELRKIHNYSYINNGAGLAVGDYDGDGLPDVYLVSQDGANKLFRQVAPLRFEDVTGSAGGVDGGDAWGTGATFVDFDGDRRLDLYVCNLEAPNLLYRNLGDGTFEECAGRYGLDHCGATIMASWADYDRDGDLDVYLLTNRVFSPNLAREVRARAEPPADSCKTVAEMQPDLYEHDWARYRRPDGSYEFPGEWKDQLFVYQDRPFFAGQADLLLRNDGDGFADVTGAAGIADQGMGLSATWWDMDADGDLDLYVANDLESPDVLYRNEGDGTFTDVTGDMLPHTAYFGMGSDFADVDGDGLLDLLVADMASTTHLKSKWLMGEMSNRGWFLEHADPQQYMRNSLFLNTGTHRFMEVAPMAGVAATDWTWSVCFGDLDVDGDEDLYVTNGIARFDNDPDMLARVRALQAEGRRDDALEVVQDLPSWPEQNFAYRNDGHLHFDRVTREWGLDREGITHGAVLVDLDRDGDLDVVTNDLNDEAGLYENRSAAGHRLLVELHGPEGNRFGIGARVEIEARGRRQIRLNIPARGYMSGTEPVVHFGLGEAETVDHLVVTWPDGRVSRYRALPADHRVVVGPPAADAAPAEPRTPEPTGLVEVTTASGLVWRHRERPFDDFAEQPLLPHKVSRLGPRMAAGDVDGDGDPDLFVGGASGQPGTLFRREEDRYVVVAGPWNAHAPSEDMGIAWLDAEGDGDPDLYVVSGGVESAPGDPAMADRLYLNDGSGRFRTAPEGTLPGPAFSGSVAAASDVDGDGDEDLVVGGRVVPGSWPSAPPSRLLRNEGGRFTDATAELAPALLEAGMVTDALWADFDGDGDDDLLVAAHWQPLRLLVNDGGRLVEGTAAAGLAGHSGWWNALVTLDVDGDGDLDAVATNFGSNHKYKKAAPGHPVGVYWADFDGDGVREIVETKYEGDRLLPVRGRSCSSNAMPFIAEKFATYEEYAKADLAEIYPSNELAGAERLEANFLQHALLRNDGEGRFAVEPLPWISQAAPSLGLCAPDLDGDGDPDVVLAQNFFSPEPETGHMDGGLGLLLRNDDGELVPVPARESGIVVPGDGRAVLWDGGHLVFARNDDALMVFERR